MSSRFSSAILQRVFDPVRGDLPADLARYLLAVRIPDADQQRIDELSIKARSGTLGPDEEAELDGYLDVNTFLAIMQSKARMSLRPAS